MTMTKPTSEQVTFLAAGEGAQQRTALEKFRDVVSVKDFGAVGDGVTDDTAAIQAAIDWVVYQNRAFNVAPDNVGPGAVYLPGGAYRITRALQLAYGLNFSSVRLYGDGAKRLNYPHLRGTAILADFNDQPAIVVQGGRRFVIESMSIVGNNLNWFTGKNFGNPNATPTIDDTVAANWVDSSFPAASSSRYAPYCAIAIDPYSGPRPAVSYPDVQFPGWLNSTSQYNKFSSAFTTIRDVDIAGFVVGVAVQPSDFDSNGDYTRILNCWFQYNQYAISVGQTQSRDIAVSNCLFQFNYCGIATGVHGRQIGDPSFFVNNCSFNFGIYAALIPSMNAGSNVGFYNCYSEALWAIGEFTGNASTAGSVGFYECDWNFSLWLPYRRMPTSVLVTNSVAITMIGTNLERQNTANEPNLLYIKADPENVTIINGFTTTGFVATKLYEKQAVNATAGLVFARCQTTLAGFSFRQPKHYDMTTGNAIPGIRLIADRTSSVSRRTCLPVYARTAIPAPLSTPPGIEIPPLGQHPINKASGTSVSQSGRMVTIDLTGAITATQLFQQGGDVGDVILDEATDTVFVVAARTGVTLELQAENNLDASGNLIPTITLGSGISYLWAINCRVFTTASVHYFDSSSSSATITNVQSLDGISRNLNDASFGIQVGDAFLVGDGSAIGVSGPSLATISAITPSSGTAVGTITIGGNARRTQTSQRLALFVKQPTANNT